jgi:filamentous hemagglutinin family protein
LALVRIALVPSALYANPTGEQVVGGAAAFNRPDVATLIVNQNTDRAVINWNSFSIANGELTKFVQPSSSSAVLNRVVTANPSAIYGTLQANGNVYLINPGGVLVGAGGVVNTASFVASTHDINTDEFMKGGQLNFKGNSDASVVNEGNITARDGDVFLIAKEVKNEGQLMAKDGTVGMVSGTEVSLQAVGQGNFKVRLMAAEKLMTENGGQKTEGSAEIVNEGVIQAANAVLEAKGSYLPMAINNTGVIEATGLVENGDGSVTLTGGEGDILNTGVVAALQRSIDGQKETGGSIMMTAKNVTSDLGSVITAAGKDGGGVVKLRSDDTTILRGSIEVVGASENARGGKVQLLGERVGLFESAKVDASGGAGGGEVLVGGDYLGKNPNVPNAKATVMGSEAKITADATSSGNGGRVILWSDEYTGFYGDISAQGGISGGNGGFVETSSKINLQALGFVDLEAKKGQGGLWLLDPIDVQIITGGTGTLNAQNTFVPVAGTPNISPTTIQATLGTASVTITTGTTGTDVGNITVTDSITDAGTGTLTLNAAGAIILNNSITFNGGTVSLIAGGGTITRNGAVTITAANVGMTGWSIGTSLSPILTAASTLAAAASGTISSTIGSSINNNTGIFISNTGSVTIGTVADTAGFTSTGQLGIFLENTAGITLTSGITSNGGPVYLTATAGTVAVNSTIQVNTSTTSARSTVGIFGAGGITDGATGAITATLLGLVASDQNIVLDSGLHEVTQLAGDTGTSAGNFTFSGSSFGVGQASYYAAGATPGSGSVVNVNALTGGGIDAQTAVTLTSSGDIVPVPATLTSSPVTVRAAGGAGIVARTLQGGVIRLDGANESFGTVSLRSNDGTDLGSGEITYTEALGDLALANLQTSGRATINFDGNLTQTGPITVGTLNLQGTGSSVTADDATLNNAANQIGAILGQIGGNLILTDSGASLFPGLEVGEVVNTVLRGLTSTTGNITLATNGDLTQVAGITAIGGAGLGPNGSPTAGFLTVDALSITLDLAASGVSLNNVNQISLASTGGDTIYRGSNGYYVQRATAPNPNTTTRGEQGAGFVSLASDSGVVRDDIGGVTPSTSTMSGDALVLLSSGSANFDLQNRNAYDFDSFAASGVGSDFYFRDTDYLVISTVNGTAGVSTGGDLVLTAGGDVTQNNTISSDNLRVTIRSAGGNYLVLSGANDVTNVSLQTRTNAGVDDPDPNLGAAATGLIYFRDVDEFRIGVNSPIGIVDPGAAVTGVVTLQGNLNVGLSNVVLESGALSAVTQLNNAGALVSTTGLGLIGGDFTINQGTAPANPISAFDSANNVSFFSARTLDNDILYREFNGFTVNFVRMNFTDVTFQGGLTEAAFQVNGIQAGNVILQVQAPTLFTQGQQGINLDFTGTDFGGNGQTLLSGFSTTDMEFDSPGYIESSGRVIINIGNSDGAGGVSEIGRFTMDEGIHIITTVAGAEHLTDVQGNRDIAIFADNMVLGRDGDPAIVVDGLIQTPDLKDTGLELLETVTLAPFTDDRQLFVSSPKAVLGNTSATGTQVNPNQLELSTGELRRVNTDRLIIRSNYTDLLTETPAVNVRSPINLYGLYDNTFAALGVFPNNAGLNRLQIQAAGGTGSYAWAEADISSDVNQLPLQVFVVSANNPYTTPDVLPPVGTLPTQGDRVVVSGGIRSYGGTVILRGQDATITGGINATTQGLVGIMPAVAGRAITLGTEPGGTLSILRSELGLVTAGTVQVGGLDFASMPAGIGNNPFYVNEFETVNAGAITITDLMSGLSADTLALVTDAGVSEEVQGGVVSPGLALIGGTTAGSNFLLDSGNNDVDRLAVYMANEGVVITGDDPVQNVVYHDQNGFGGGNGFEVALVQQQAEQGLLRSTATAGAIPVGTGLGLIRANQLSITAGGDVTVYDVIPAGGPTSTSYIGHVPTVPGTPVVVLGNLVNLLAIDASTPFPETGGVNEVFFSAANGLGVGDIGPNGTNLRGGVAGILTNGGAITLEGNDIQIYTVNRATGDDINIDTTADGIAPDGARVVLRPSTGFNGFVNRAGAGAPVEILLGGAAPGAPVENVATLALDGILDLAKVEIGAAGVRASVLEIGSRSNPATYAGKISVADNFNTFSPLLEVLHLLAGGAIEDIRATTETLLTGLTVNSLAAEANGSISLIGALNSIGTFAAESNFGQSEVRLVNERAGGLVLGTVDGISGILSSTFAAQLTAGGLTQTPGSTIEAGLLSINTSAGNGNVSLNSENGVAQVAINAGTGNILLRTTGNTRIVSSAASQPGGVPAAVSGLTGSFITLYSGGDVSQDANAPITRGGTTTPTAVTVVTQNGFSITLDATSNRLPANSVFAAVTSSGALGNLTNLTLVNGTGGGGLELGSGAVIDLNLTSAGSGYTGSPVPLTATISAPAGAGGTTATGQVVAGVKTVGVTSAGAGYLSAPTVTISGTGGAAAVAIVDSNPLSSTYGQVTSIQITDPGTGYLTLPTVTLSGGSPTQAAVVAATELQITGLVITNPGSRYNATPTVTISGTGGSGAAGATSVGGTGGVYFASGSSVSGGITGNLNIRNLSAALGISQQATGTAGAIAVAGTTTLADSSAAGIIMGNNNNNLQGTITVTQSGGGNVAIGNNNSSVLGNLTLSGGLGAQTLTVTSTGGSIYQFNNANVITAPGAASFFATANGLATGTPVGAVILNNALNNFVGSVSAAGTRVIIRDNTALDLGAVTASTSLTATSTSAGITQSGVISSTGAASFAAAAGQSIILGDSSNAFGSTVSFSALSGQLQNVTVTDSTALNLQALNILGDLVATGAGLTQSGILQAANADLRSTGSGNSLNLSTFNNNFSGQVRILSDGDASLLDNGPLIIGNGGASIVAGNLTLSSAGALSQTQAITVSGTGTSSISTTVGSVTFSQNISLLNGNLTVAPATTFTQSGGTLSLGTGTLAISSTGLVQQTGGNMVVAGTVTVNSGGAAITLNSGSNDFQGAVTLTGGVTQITDGVGGLTFGTVNTGDLTAITTAAGGALNLGQGTVTGFLTATTSNGNISQNGILTVTGATTLTAGTGNIVLGSANSLENVTVNSATDVTLRNTALTAGTLLYPNLPAALQNLTLIFDNSAATLSANPASLTGSLSITAGGGAISSVNPISVIGATTLSAGSSAITFDDATNNFVGTVTIGGTGVVTMEDANNLTLVGQQSLNLGNITTGGAFTVSSPANITSTSGTEINTGGTITLTAGNNADVKVDQNDNALIGSVNVAETFTLRTDAAIGFTLGGAGGFGLSDSQLNNFRVGTFAPVADGANITIPTAFNYGGIQNLSLTTLNSGNIIANGGVSVGTLSLSSSGSATFSAVNQIQNLGNVTVASGGLTFRNGRGLNLTGTVSMPQRFSLEVAGQFYNQTGQSQPLAGVAGGSVIKSLSLMGGLPNQVSGLAGFTVRYDGVMPTSGNVTSYALSPLAQFAPSGTTIAGVNLGGTQTGGGQFNTFLTGSDNLNWMISDFGRFNMPTVKPSGMDYILYPQRVEPETRTLPAATLGQLERELGRPPTIDEIQAREVALREAAMVRSGAILERSSFDAVVDEVDKQESAEVPAQVIDGGKPQAGGPSVAPNPLSGGAMEGLGVGPQARKTQSVRQGSNGPILRSGPIRSVAQLRPAEPSQSGNISEGSVQALKLDAKSVIEQERASAEVGIAPPIAAGR